MNPSSVSTARTADLFSKTRDPLQLVLESRRLAADNNLLVIDKGGCFMVFRRARGRNIYLGECGSPAALLRKVSRCAGSRSEARP
jgi:hypothetical protein